MKNILIYGASGHSKMIVDIILKNNNYSIVGFIDSYKEVGEVNYGFKILGNLDRLDYLVKKFNVYGIVIGIGDNTLRQKAYRNIIEITPNLEFIPVVHPTAILAIGIEIPQGTVIMANVVVNADAKIGEFCILNTKSSLGHDSRMFNFSSLASGAIVGGNVSIGECSAICLGASLIQNISIGNYTIVGAASLVIKSIGNYKKAFGSPIHTIKKREKNSFYLGKNKGNNKK